MTLRRGATTFIRTQCEQESWNSAARTPIRLHIASGSNRQRKSPSTNTSLKSVPQGQPRCPISRSFFARCGIPRTLMFFACRMENCQWSDASPTSRRKTSQMIGAPFGPCQGKIQSQTTCLITPRHADSAPGVVAPSSGCRRFSYRTIGGCGSCWYPEKASGM